MPHPNRPGPAPGKPNQKVVGGLVAAVVVLAVCGPMFISLGFTDNDGTDVPPPTVTERADTVAILRAAAESQGICYGWRLENITDAVSVGSNLGDGVAVQDNPQCPRWVQVVADVYYPAEHSEAADRAYVFVEGSDDFRPGDLFSVTYGLERFGLTEDVFVDDPGWATTRAAVTLPLLVAEQGHAAPAPVVTAAPGAPPSPLPAAGSDLWRDRWGYLIAVASLFLIAALLVTVGLVQRRRQRRQAVPGQRTGPGRPAASGTLITPTARRTRG